MSKYTYKGTEFITIPIPLTGRTKFHINNDAEVDKIRITVSDSLNVDENAPIGLVLRSSLTNMNPIGTVATNLLYRNTIVLNTYNNFQQTLTPNDGLEFFYPMRSKLEGTYDLSVLTFEDNLPDASYIGSIFIMIEYYTMKEPLKINLGNKTKLAIISSK